MADAATPYEKALIGEGLPPTFLAELRALTTYLEQTLSARDTSKRAQVRSTKGVYEEERSGVAILKLLESLVKRAGANSAEFRDWQTARHVLKSRRALPTPTTTPPATSAAA